MTVKAPGLKKRVSAVEGGGPADEEGTAASEGTESKSSAQAAEEKPDWARGEAEEQARETPSDGGERQKDAGWTEKSIEELLRTVDAVSSDAAETRSMVERLPGADGQGETGEQVSVQTGDFHRWVERDRLRRRRWTVVAAAVAAPAALLLGLLVQQQFEVIPLHDPTRGWGGHIWEMYGRTIVDCALEAIRTDAEVNCPLTVRRP